MKTKPCPNCGEPKHPLKCCNNCGHSNLRQEHDQRIAEGGDLSKELPSGKGYGTGFLGLNRIYFKRKKSDRVLTFWADEETDQEIYRGNDAPFTPFPQSDDPEFSNNLEAVSPGSFNHRVNYQGTSQTFPLLKASIWLEENLSPTLPTRKKRNVPLFDGWGCPETIAFAQRLITQHPEASLREVQQEILKGFDAATLSVPNLWYVWCGQLRVKALYEDANHLPFIRVEKKWHLAYEISRLGGLVEVRGMRPTRDKKYITHGCFICWQNEDLAINYHHYRKLRKQEANIGK